MSKKVLHSSLAVLLAAILLCAAFPFSPAAAEKSVLQLIINDQNASVFLEGGTFVPAGYEGLLVYDDGSTQPLTAAEMTYETDSPLKTDSKVTFTYGSYKSAPKPVKVLQLDALTFSGTYQQNYYGGLDVFNPEGLTFRAQYTGTVNGQTVNSSAEVSLSELKMSPAAQTVLSSKNKSVFFTYAIGARTATVPVPVNVKAVQSLNIRNIPEGPFYEGLHLVYDSETQVLVEAIYEGETVPKAVSNPQISEIEKPIHPNADSSAVFTVSLDGTTKTFSVPVVPLTDVSATSPNPRKDIYLHKDNTFSVADITVTAHYADGAQKDVTDETLFTCPEPNVPFQAGDTVTAEFAGRKLDLSSIVVVHSAAIEVVSEPTKTSYKEGEQFVQSGFTALIRYDNGTFYSPLGQFLVTVSNPLQVSDDYVLFSWNGLEYRQPITVTPTKNVTIRIVNAPDKISYFSNEPLSLAGLVVSIQREGDPTPTILSSGQYTTIPAENTPVADGTTEIIIRYSLSDTVYYDVHQPIQLTPKSATGIAVTTQPTKLRYFEGEVFNPDGMTISLVYSDNTVTEIKDGYEISKDPLILQREADTEQNVTIPVTYGGMHTAIAITVQSRRIDRMEILTQPEKKEYQPGESFDQTGMVVAIYFADDPYTAVLLTDSYYKLSPAGALPEGTAGITVSFRDVSATVSVVVGEGGVITTEPTPADTTGPESSGADVTTSVPITTGEPDTTTKPEGPATTASPETTGTSSGRKPSSGNTGLLVLWIVIIAIILAGLVVLIIYYKRNFT